MPPPSPSAVTHSHRHTHTTSADWGPSHFHCRLLAEVRWDADHENKEGRLCCLISAWQDDRSRRTRWEGLTMSRKTHCCTIHFKSYKCIKVFYGGPDLTWGVHKLWPQTRYYALAFFPTKYSFVPKKYLFVTLKYYFFSYITYLWPWTTNVVPQSTYMWPLNTNLFPQTYLLSQSRYKQELDTVPINCSILWVVPKCPFTHFILFPFFPLAMSGVPWFPNKWSDLTLNWPDQ